MEQLPKTVRRTDERAFDLENGVVLAAFVVALA
jgi:hypothetical protein